MYKPRNCFLLFAVLLVSTSLSSLMTQIPTVKAVPNPVLTTLTCKHPWDTPLSYRYHIKISHLVVGQAFIFRMVHCKGAVDCDMPLIIGWAIFGSDEAVLEYCGQSVWAIRCDRVNRADGIWEGTIVINGLPGSVSDPDWVGKVTQVPKLSDQGKVKGPIDPNLVYCIGGESYSIEVTVDANRSVASYVGSTLMIITATIITAAIKRRKIKH